MVHTNRSGYCTLNQYRPDLLDVWTHHLLPFLLPSRSESKARKAVMLFYLISIGMHLPGMLFAEYTGVSELLVLGDHRMKTIWIRPDLVSLSFERSRTSVKMLWLSECVSFLVQYNPSYEYNPHVQWNRESIEVFHDGIVRYVLEDDDVTFTRVEYPPLPQCVQDCVHRTRMLFSVWHERPTLRHTG